MKVKRGSMTDMSISERMKVLETAANAFYHRRSVEVENFPDSARQIHWMAFKTEACDMVLVKKRHVSQIPADIRMWFCPEPFAHPHLVRLIVRDTEFVGLRGVIHERLGPFEVYTLESARDVDVARVASAPAEEAFVR
jgi:hypothetical protein